MTRALAFLSSPGPDTYGSHFSRLRWRRAVKPELEAVWDPESSAASALAFRDAGVDAAADTWVVVLEETALPGPGRVPAPPAGRVLLAQAAVAGDPPFIHTLRELEGSALIAAGDTGRRGAAALTFRASDFPAVQNEPVESFLDRLSESAGAAMDPAFRVIRFDDPSNRERPELTRRLPPGRVRILDAGCGGGRGIGAARARNPEWSLTGIERDPALAARAREVCDRVIEGDLMTVLPGLASAGERFDVLVFADVLEHLEDPISALAKGRAIAAAGATLVVSVPNVGHVSIVRDLVAGRFDPVPAGLCDGGHLRWFTRGWLSEALDEAGWRVVTIEGERGAPAADAEAFLKLADGWTGADRGSLETYQWVAVCRAE